MALDGQIRERFVWVVERAVSGDFVHWEETGDSALALVIVLDQFTR